MIVIAAITGAIGYLNGIDAIFCESIMIKGLTNNWFLYTVLFVSYNTVMAIAVLAPPLGV
ncbi:hypothetical protein [Paramaledivibacter caminithermalis]|jgi:hypothetical protein|uniref:hypothetical protein n=1 Tax=Paramaledivibacter caminithermalis TaxID=191027 RepID=UPI000932CA68|nr:hypothetical protein [Paramaledivibacter caminithermalis]